MVVVMKAKFAATAFESVRGVWVREVIAVLGLMSRWWV